jgi:probable H4MPT-linked C1 transfer pathway protein
LEQKTLTEVIGYDIGGANTKVAFIKTLNGVLEEVETDMAYFPVWKKSQDLPIIIESLRTKVSNSKKLDCIAITMTAELSDVYRTKREGVVHILEVVEKIFPKTPIMILDVEGKFQSIEEAKAEPLRVAAANWAATGWLVSKFFEQCIIIDIGSTSASIIPVIDGFRETYERRTRVHWVLANKHCGICE